MRLIRLGLVLAQTAIIAGYEKLFLPGRLTAYPGAWMRYKVSGTPDFLHYVSFGRECYDVMKSLLDEYGCTRTFDYGCGCGRVARYFRPMIDGWDPDFAAKDWCRNHGIIGTMADGRVYDSVISVSVFSHIYEIEQQMAFVRIASMLRPGGYLILTTHPGEPSYRHSHWMSSYFSTTHGVLVDPACCGLRLVRKIERGLVGVQDVYIYRKEVR